MGSNPTATANSRANADPTITGDLVRLVEVVVALLAPRLVRDPAALSSWRFGWLPEQPTDACGHVSTDGRDDVLLPRSHGRVGPPIIAITVRFEICNSSSTVAAVHLASCVPVRRCGLGGGAAASSGWRPASLNLSVRFFREPASVRPLAGRRDRRGWCRVRSPSRCWPGRARSRRPSRRH